MNENTTTPKIKQVQNSANKVLNSTQQLANITNGINSIQNGKNGFERAQGLGQVAKMIMSILAS